MSDKPYTPTPFQVTATVAVKPVHYEYCEIGTKICKSFEPFNEYCAVYNKHCGNERLPECLAAEQAAKEAK